MTIIIVIIDYHHCHHYSYSYSSLITSPEVLAKTLLPHLNRKTDRDSWCILQARVGAGQEALHRLDEEYEKTSEMMTSLLRNVFSVKDMEVCEMMMVNNGQ